MILADALRCAHHGGMPCEQLPLLATRPYLLANTMT